jgi:hypothetical protein
MNAATHGADALTARLGSLEELVWLYDQTSPFHCVMGATFIGAETAAPWREVLDALQRRHPLLRVRIERDASTYPKFVTDEAARIPLRTGEADIGWAGEMSRELQMSFDPRNAPLIRAVVSGDTTGSTLLLTAHHAIADAISLTWVFRDVLLLLSGQKLEPLAPTGLSRRDARQCVTRRAREAGSDAPGGESERCLLSRTAASAPSCALAESYSRDRREGALGEHDRFWHPECGRDPRRPLVIRSVADGALAVSLPCQFETSCRISGSCSRVLQHRPAAPRHGYWL